MHIGLQVHSLEGVKSALQRKVNHFAYLSDPKGVSKYNHPGPRIYSTTIHTEAIHELNNPSKITTWAIHALKDQRKINAHKK